MARYNALGWFGVLAIVLFCVSFHRPVLLTVGTLMMLVAAIRGDVKWFAGVGTVVLLTLAVLVLAVGD